MDWIEILTVFLAPLTGIISWFASKTRYQADTDSVIVQNSAEVIKQWRELAEKYERELTEIRKRLGTLEDEHEQEKEHRQRVEKELEEEKRKRKHLEDQIKP